MMSRAKGKKQAQTASKPTILPTPIFNRYSTATFSPFVHSKTSAVVVHLTIAELELLEYLESAAAELSYNQALKAYSFQFDCQLGDVRDTARYLGRFGFLGFDFGGHQDDPVYSVVDPNEPVPTHVVLEAEGLCS